MVGGIRYTLRMPRKSSAANAPKRSDTNVRRTIGANIKARRLTLGWSQQELAERFGVSRAAVSQYEIGTGEVNAGDLPRLADILGVSLLDLYGNPPPVHPPLRVRGQEETLGLPSVVDDDGEWIPMRTVSANRSTDEYGGATQLGVLYKVDYDQRTAVHVGSISDPAQAEATLTLLASVLALSPDDRETVRRVADALLGASGHRLNGADR